MSESTEDQIVDSWIGGEVSDYPVREYISWPTTTDESGQRFDMTDREMLGLFYDTIRENERLAAEVESLTTHRDGLIAEVNRRGVAIRETRQSLLTMPGGEFWASVADDLKVQREALTAKTSVVQKFLIDNSHKADRDSSCDGCVVLAILERD